MSYVIEAGMWSSVFAVPSVIVDDHLRMCPPLSLRILLWMLRHPGVQTDAAMLSQTLMYPQNDIVDAMQYWIAAGILQSSDAPVQPAARPDAAAAPATIAAPAIVETSETVLVDSADGAAPTTKKITTVSAQRPRITRAQIADLSKTDISVGSLLGESQDVLGHPLSPVEGEIIISLYTYYGFPVEVVLMLLQYCVSINKANMNYVEKVAASWAESNINTLERADDAIKQLTQNNENEKKILSAFSVYNRALTSREREYVAKWFATGLDEHVLCLACERAVDNTGKPSFAYADKIIMSWQEKGIRSVQQAVQELKSGSGAKKRQTQNISAQTGDSSLDKQELHDLLHSQFLDEA